MVSDNKGKTTGVFIPISEWNELKQKYKVKEKIEVPEHQQEEVRKRLEEYIENPSQGLDFETTIDAIEKEL